MIEIKSINKSFGNKLVLDNLNLKIKKGKAISIVGRNGTGKTTLSKIIAGITNPDSGEVIINSKEGFHSVALQFQELNALSDFNAKDLIKYYSLHFADVTSKEEIEELIDLFEVRSFIDTKISKMSGGQKQRLNLLTTLIKKSEILILDEFVTGMDIISVEGILNYINDLKVKNNLTIIIISHQPDEIKKLADEVCVLANGKINKCYSTIDIDKKYNGDFKDFLLEVLNE